jgi:hypothetical protein
LSFWYFFPTAVPFLGSFLVGHPSTYRTARSQAGDRRLKIHECRDNLVMSTTLSFPTFSGLVGCTLIAAESAVLMTVPPEGICVSPGTCAWLSAGLVMATSWPRYSA